MDRLERIMKWYPAFASPPEVLPVNTPQIIHISSDFLCGHLDPKKDRIRAATLIGLFQDDIRHATLPEEHYDTRHNLLTIMRKIGRGLVQDTPSIQLYAEDLIVLRNTMIVREIAENYYRGIAENKLVRIGAVESSFMDQEKPFSKPAPHAGMHESNVVPLRAPSLSEVWQEPPPKSEQDLAGASALRIALFNKIIDLVMPYPSPDYPSQEHLIFTMNG